jgi:hypothetical protein
MVRRVTTQPPFTELDLNAIAERRWVGRDDFTEAEFARATMTAWSGCALRRPR